MAPLGTAVLHCSLLKVMPEGHSPQCLFHLASECMVDSPILSNGLFCCKHYLRGRFRWCQLFTCVSTAELFFFFPCSLSGMILGGLLLCNYFEIYKIEEKRTSFWASYKLIFFVSLPGFCIANICLKRSMKQVIDVCTDSPRLHF